jgi:hypothetical protein
MLKNLILAVVMVFVALPAQAGECPKMKAHKEEMQKFLTGELGLDADKADKVSALLHDSFAKKKAAKKAKHEAFEALAKLVEAKEPKVEAYEAALKNLKDAKAGYLAAKTGNCDAMGELLDAKQIATLKVHMHKAHGGDGHHGHHGKGHKGCKGDGSCGCKGDCGCKGECKGDCKGDCGCKKGKDKACGCKGGK